MSSHLSVNLELSHDSLILEKQQTSINNHLTNHLVIICTDQVAGSPEEKLYAKKTLQS